MSTLNQIESMNVQVGLNFSAKWLWYALASAFGGGSAYWVKRLEVVDRPTRAIETIEDVPFFGGSIRVLLKAANDVEGAVKLITLDTLQAGMAFSKGGL